MQIIDLALKDLSQILRDRKSILFLVIMPVVFTAFMGFIFNNSAKPQDPRLAVGVINLDEGTLSQPLPGLLESSGALRAVTLEAAEATRVNDLVHSGQYAGILVIPAEFSRQALHGQTPRLTLVADDISSSGQTVRQLAQAAVVRMWSAVEIGQLSAQPASGSADYPQAVEAGVQAAASAWQKPTLVVKTEQVSAAEPEAQLGFSQTSPGMLVQFTIFGLVNSAMLLVLERKSKTFERLLTTSMKRTKIIAGHLLAMFLVSFLQETILVLVGQFVFGVDYLREPLAILLVMAALALWVASLGLFIGAMSKQEDQVILATMIAMFGFSALGGVWFPLEGVGSTFAALGHWMPSAWAMDGFQNVIVRGQGLSSVLLPAGLLCLYTLAFFGLAAWRIQKEA